VKGDTGRAALEPTQAGAGDALLQNLGERVIDHALHIFRADSKT
jgi:hypothetical protein